MHFKELLLNQLRARWAEVWQQQPHARIGRTMLEKSLEYKTGANLSSEQSARLNELIKKYKRDPKCFDSVCKALKPGARLDRIYKGKTHSVLVTECGFEYQDKLYKSLSKIANDITGKRWNGWVFFGLKKVGSS